MYGFIGGPMEPQQRLHYHIRWSGKEMLDWQAFASRDEAEARARELVRPGEAYAIEAHGQLCRRCQAAMTLKQAHA